MSSDVVAAFDMLLEALSEECKRAAEAIRELNLQGSFNEVQRLLAKAERLKQVSKEIERLRTVLESSGLLRPAQEYLPDKETPKEKLPKINEEFGTPGGFLDEIAPEENLIHNIFGPKARQTNRRKDEITPQREFRRPILEALGELGGRERTRQVLEVVYRRMEGKLTKSDRERLRSGDVRWRKFAQWERYCMARDGLLRRDSPTGIWELSEAGWAELRRLR